MKTTLLIFFLLFSGAISAQNQQLNTKNMILEYSDGNGNFYKITIGSIVYKPVTAEMSSSGIYDGGKPSEKTITETEFLEVKKIFDAIFANTNIHIQHRIKTSGKLTVKNNTNTMKEVIIAISSEQKELENLLKQLLSN